MGEREGRGREREGMGEIGEEKRGNGVGWGVG